MANIQPKKTKKSKKPKAKKSKKIKITRQPKINLNQYVESVCALVDPFCPASAATRWPDSNSAPTIPAKLEGFIPITTDASGNFACLIHPELKGGIITYTVNNGNGNCTAPVLSDYNGITAFTASEYRLVSAGAKVLSTAAMTSTQGIMRMMQMGSFTTLPTIPNAFSYTYVDVNERPLRDNGGLTGILAPGSESSRQFIPYNSVAANGSYDWSPIFISVQGAAASTTVGRVHYVANFEMKFGDNYAFNFLARPPTGPLPVITSMVNSTVSEIGSVFQGTYHEVENSIKQSVRANVRDKIMGLLQTGFSGAPLLLLN